LSKAQKEKTPSEQLFEHLCAVRGIRFEPIPQKKSCRTPDYRVWLNHKDQIIVEVKQMDLSKDDLQFIKEVDKGKEISSGVRATGHTRIRNIIGNAYPQLRGFEKGLCPAIIVIFDNTKGISCMDNEDILNAMYGDEIVTVHCSEYAEREVTVVGHKFGGHRKVTPNTNSALSAICFMHSEPVSGLPSLSVFHNIYAEFPLKPEVAWQIADKQYTIPTKSCQYHFWTEIVR